VILAYRLFLKYLAMIFSSESNFLFKSKVGSTPPLQRQCPTCRIRIACSYWAEFTSDVPRPEVLILLGRVYLDSVSLIVTGLLWFCLFWKQIYFIEGSSVVISCHSFTVVVPLVTISPSLLDW
jgi:hypothetical protein